MTIRSSRSIGAPAHRVHEVLVDVAAWSLWSPHVVAVHPLGDSDGTRVHPGWRARVRPWFGPATTMHVTDVRPDGGYAWTTTALRHRLDYDLVVRPVGEDRCVLTLTAEVTGPAAGLVERLVGWLSALGQRRRAARVAALAEGWQRVG